ncbi:MAG: acyl carrier protein [Devosia sp.]
MTRDGAVSIVVAAIERSSIAAIPAHVRDAFSRGEAAEISLSEIGVDSLGAIELCLAIEEDTGVDIQPSRLKPTTTVAELADLVIG